MVAGRVIVGNSDAFFGSITIGGSDYPVEYGRFIAPLKPGTHTISRVFSSSSGSSASPVSGVNSVTTTSTVIYPINRQVTVKENQAVLTGTLYVLRDDPPSKEILVFQIDTQDRIKAYLKTLPAFAGWTDERFVGPGWKFVAPGTVANLQRLMIAKAVKQDSYYQYAKRIGHGAYAGPLATLGRVTLSNGKYSVRLFPQDGIDRLDTCRASRADIACTAFNWAGEKMFVYVDNGQSQAPAPLPVSHEAKELILEDDTNVYLVTDHLEVLVSHDKGHSWSVAQEALRKKPLGFDDFMNVYSGERGLYINTTADVRLVLHKKPGESTFQPLTTPDWLGYGDINETHYGLYIGPEFSLFSRSKLFFQDSNGNWSRYELPGRECSHLYVVGNDDEELIAQCAPGYYLSTDRAKTWSEIDRENALQKVQKG